MDAPDKIAEHAENILRTLVRDEKENCYFKKVNLGRFIISIQASETHYSKPRKTLPSADEYDAFEVAIFDDEDDWVNPRRDNRLQHLSWTKKFEDGSSPVCGFVAREDLLGMLRDLLIVSNRSMN